MRQQGRICMPKLRMTKCEGEVTIPASKSISHRALICSALATGKSVISNVTFSKDILATISCLRSLGQEIEVKENQVIVNPQPLKKLANLDANESGSTLRFMIPLMLLQKEEITITGQNHLKKRPIADFFTVFEQNEIKYTYNGELPLTVEGLLKPGKYTMNGNVSSQFISGLLMALPLLASDSEIILATSLESKDYVEMTIKVCEQFGVKILKTSTGYLIPGGQKYQAQNYEIEGDFSQAAFFLVLNSLGGNLKLKGLKRTGMQGDERILNILETFGVKFNSSFQVVSKDLKSQTISLKDEPDLAPVLGVFATQVPGVTNLIDLHRLKFKECDRLAATKDLITNLGGKVVVEGDTLKITGPTKLHKGMVATYNDHRILMSAAVAAFVLDEVEVDDLKPVNKSFPNFFTIYQAIGGEVCE